MIKQILPNQQEDRRREDIVLEIKENKKHEQQYLIQPELTTDGRNQFFSQFIFNFQITELRCCTFCLKN